MRVQRLRQELEATFEAATAHRGEPSGQSGPRHAALAQYFLNEAAAAGTGLLAERFLELVARHQLASRNTVSAPTPATGKRGEKEQESAALQPLLAPCSSSDLPVGLFFDSPV